ncbi:putative signal transducing protein [Pseudomonas aeruginosa]
MQRVYEPADLLEAEMLVGMLASEGIAAHVSGRHLVGAIGELPPGGLLALLVADGQTERARELILAYNAAAPLAEEPPRQPVVLRRPPLSRPPVRRPASAPS